MFYFVPLAYDRIQNGQGKGSKARCEALIWKMCLMEEELYTDGKIITNCWFGSLAGYTKESPGRPTIKVPVALCDQMKEYTIKLGYPRTGVFFSDPQAWGTYEEIRYALQKIIAEQRYNYQTSNDVYFSTNFGHSFRVCICIWFLKRELGMDNSLFRFHVLLANHSFSKKEYFQETAKFFQYLYRFVFDKPFK